MNQEHWRNIYHANVNVRMMVKNVTWIKSEIASAGVSVKIEKKKHLGAKKVIFEILQHVTVKSIIIALLTAISIYLIKHWSKQKHLLLNHDTSKSKETDNRNIL